MSFSFNIRAASIAAALAIAASEMDKVIETQPSHKADRATVLAAVKGQVGLLEATAEGKHVVLSVNGSLSWQNAGDDVAGKFTGANVSIGAYLVAADASHSHLPVLREA